MYSPLTLILFARCKHNGILNHNDEGAAMKFRRYLVASALVIGSVGIGSAITQGSAAPATDPAAPTEAPESKTWPGGPKPTDGTSSQLVDGGYVFVPISPYRSYDSRDYRDGRIQTGEEHYFTVLTDEFGVGQIPSTAVAVTFNLTVTNTIDRGWLGVFPADVNWPGNSSVNWTASGATTSNGGTTAIGYLDEDGQMSILKGGPAGGSTHYIVDITGYYV
jgi:hypothetical protein